MLYHYIPSSGLDYGLDFGHCAIRTSHKMAQRLWKRGASTVRHMTKYAHMYRKREKERERETLGHVHVHRHRHVYVGEVQEHHFSPVFHFFRPVSVSRTSTPMARHGRSWWKYQKPPRVGFSECDNWNINRNRDSNQTG